MMKKLVNCPYGKCRVYVNDYGDIELYSYSTLVITIDRWGWLTCTGTYSQTTRKHIGAFLKEYAPCWCYQHVKAAYLSGYSFNIHTGEIRPKDYWPESI